MGSSRGKISYAWDRYHGKEHGPWYDGSFWTQDRKDKLLAQRNEVKSLKEAAKVMGCSEGALGGAWRLFYSKELGSW